MGANGTNVHQGILSLSALPPAPEVLLRLWRIVDDPRAAAKDIAAVVGTDPALCAELLKASNSAHYGFDRPVESIAEAVTLLGAQTVVRLSMTLLVRHGLLPRCREPEAFDRVDFWKHCIATAIATDHLAQEVSLWPRSAAYPAGLLHDVGVMVLDIVAPKELGAVIRAIGKGVSPLEAEREAVGCTHAEIGRAVADAWRFPRAVRDAIVHHHSPLNAPLEARPLTCVVALADGMMSMSEPTCYSAADATRLTAAQEHLKVSDDILSQVEQATRVELKTLENLLSIAS